MCHLEMEACKYGEITSFRCDNYAKKTPNGWRYPLVGGTRSRHFDGTSFKPRNLPENAQTPTSRVHTVLGSALTRHLAQLPGDGGNPAPFHKICPCGFHP